MILGGCVGATWPVGNISKRLSVVQVMDLKLHNNRGNAYINLGQYQRAVEDYAKTCSQDSEYC